jgi:hypothetical protein
VILVIIAIGVWANLLFSLFPKHKEDITFFGFLTLISIARCCRRAIGASRLCS